MDKRMTLMRPARPFLETGCELTAIEIGRDLMSGEEIVRENRGILPEVLKDIILLIAKRKC